MLKPKSYLLLILIFGTLGACQKSTAPLTSSASATSAPASSHLMITKEQFNVLFPKRIDFYTYDGLIKALSAYPAFGNTGNEEVQKQEIAAFLANLMHESDELRAKNEYNTANYDKYCNDKEGVICAPGKQYYGRGPIQLSWNFNYDLAGKALGLDLLNDPDLVARDATVAWKTAIWYWMTIKGPAPVPSHEAMTQSAGFGETIRSINGVLECQQPTDSVGHKQAELRVENYLKITKLLGVDPGKNLRC
jgi:predicted chitinase